MQGEAGIYSVNAPAALFVESGAYQHTRDICLGTGGVASPEINGTPGLIYFETNTSCIAHFGGGNGPGAQAAVDDGKITVDLTAGTVQAAPNPTYCCQYNESLNAFTSNALYFADRGTVVLTFNSDGTVNGSIQLGGCQIAPYCVAPATYVVSVSGKFAHP